MSGKILIIDDSTAMHRLLAVWLRPLSTELLFASDGERGIAMAIQAQPDAILLDVSMQGESGFDICRRLKCIAETRLIPVVFLSASSTAEDKIRGLDIGAMDYITKPCDAAELVARMRAAVRTRELIDLLATKARIDGLTGLYNRAYFDERLAGEIAMSRRHGHSLSLITIDVDHFKSINDAFGHAIGDDALRAIAQTIRNRCRAEDIVCRIGGDELVVLTPGVPIEGAMKLAADLCREVEALRLPAREETLRMSLSIGVADLQPETSQSIVQRSDEALYEAKRRGRNQAQTEFRHRESLAMA